MIIEPMPRIAAILFKKGQAVDQLLEMVARDLQAAGHVVQGYLQRELAPRNGSRAAVELESIADGTTHRIFQPLGRDARGCRLDPQALASVCTTLLAALSDATGLVIFNRFGKGEVEGAGLRVAIERAFLRDIPVLTAVRPEYLQEWRAFTGGWHVEFELQADALGAWLDAVVAPRQMPIADGVKGLRTPSIDRGRPEQCQRLRPGRSRSLRRPGMLAKTPRPSRS